MHFDGWDWMLPTGFSQVQLLFFQLFLCHPHQSLFTYWCHAISCQSLEHYCWRAEISDSDFMAFIHNNSKFFLLQMSMDLKKQYYFTSMAEVLTEVQRGSTRVNSFQQKRTLSLSLSTIAWTFLDISILMVMVFGRISDSGSSNLPCSGYSRTLPLLEVTKTGWQSLVGLRVVWL